MRTVGGAIREHLMAQFQGRISGVFLDFAPETVNPIYMTYNDMVSYGPSLRGDGESLRFARSMQYNLWQRTDLEDDALFTDIVNYMDGLIVEVDGFAGSIRVGVEGATRVPEPQETGLIHHEVTINLHTVPGTP